MYFVTLFDTVCSGSRYSIILRDPLTLPNLTLPESISLLVISVGYVMYSLFAVALMDSLLSASTHSLELLCDRVRKDSAGKLATRALPIG